MKKRKRERQRFLFPEFDYEEPQAIVERCIHNHTIAISGFGGNPNVNKTLLKEACTPIHAAISLEGEPTLYPHLDDLVEAFYERGFKSVFIVTNGLNPKSLDELKVEPSQLYVSVCAPDEKTYNQTCRPLIPNGWNRLMESLELLRSFDCPTVLRHTLLPNINMHNLNGYAKLAEVSDATYIEPKAAMSVGYARKRFGYEEMAWHEDIRRFAKALAYESGYNILDEHSSSSIVLLSKLKKPKKLF